MRALLVGIDLDTARQIGETLEASWPGVSVRVAETARAALELLAEEPADIVLLGDELRGGALMLASELCARAGGPVLLVADPAGPLDIRLAPSLGVVDIVARPFTPWDLEVRVCAALARRSVECADEPTVMEADGLRIDYAAASVTVGGNTVQLAPTEYGLLYHLSRNANRVLTYRTLLAKVWGRSYITETELLDAQVESLRRKLGERRTVRPCIGSRFGVGYVFETQGIVEQDEVLGGV